jgi:SAM-dependent methyltransferase
MRNVSKIPKQWVEKMDRLQSAYFSAHKDVFNPPLPKGVAERLAQIVASAKITQEDTILDVGTGTGILIPLIRKYGPKKIYANDLSKAMLASVNGQFPEVETVIGDISRLTLSEGSIDVVFINACYPNIMDKHAAFLNINRMTRQGARVVISHPLGRGFIEILKEKMPFPLDDFPEDRMTANGLLGDYGFEVESMIDESDLYILVLRCKSREL